MAQIQIPLKTFKITKNPKTIKMTNIPMKTFKMTKNTSKTTKIIKILPKLLK